MKSSARRVAFAAVASFALVAAQQSVLTVPFYGYDKQTIDASVIAADSTATTLQLQCPAGSGNDCGLAASQTMTIGPSVYNIVASEPGSFTMTQDCSTMGTTGAVCTESITGGNDDGSSVVTYTSGDVEVIPVTITAGITKLGAPASIPAITTSGADITLITGTHTPTSSAGGLTSSQTGSAPAETSTGAAPLRSTVQNEAVGFIAGVAGLLAVAF